MLVLFQTNLHLDDLELTQRLTVLYEDLRYLRESLEVIPSACNMNLPTSLTSSIEGVAFNPKSSKPRSGSEPNILTNRRRVITIIDDFQ
jgi:hypothetical protein